MLRSVRRLAMTGLLVSLVLAGLQLTAEARGSARVSGLAAKAQSRCASTVRVSWRAVRGATYQVRWASSKRAVRAATPMASRGHATSIGPVAGARAYYQVRAVVRGRPGTWSGVRSGRPNARRSGQPRLSGNGVPGGAQFTWGCTPNASRYRVAWSAAPFGKWPNPLGYVSGWLPQSARSSIFAVPAAPQSGDHMLGVAYANPVYGQLEAANAKGRVRRSSGWVPVFPTPPDPGPGDAMRLGTYNVLGAPTSGPRITAIAANISSHGLGVVALQEASTGTAQAVAAALGAGWGYVPAIGGFNQVVYRTSSYRLGRSGSFPVGDPASSTPIITGWARLDPVNLSAPHQSVYVVSVHLGDNANRSDMDRKHDAGVGAQTIMDNVNAIDTTGAPVVVAGDLRYLREPFSDVPGYVEAPPTLVRGGYYDAMAALSKTNVEYQTYNYGNGTTAPAQAAHVSGAGARADYIMLKGFRGSNAYVNVANWSWNGLTPSDHNLVYADLTVPFSG